MKYGMPTLIEFKSILENILFAKNNNLDFIEVNMNLPYCFNLKKGELNKYKFDFTMHLSEELNIGELNDSLFEKYLNEIKWQIELGISNNIKRYTIHLNSGVHFTVPDKKIFLNDIYLDIYLKHIKKSCDILNKIARDNDIYINFENTKIEDFTVEAIKIIDSYKYLGFTLDIGHNEKNKNKAFKLFNDTGKIRHIHMHDYDSSNDHLALGDGCIDFSKYNEVIKNNYVVIEVKKSEELIKSINYIS